MIKAVSILFFCGVLVITSCRSTKTIQTAIAKKDTVVIAAIVTDPHADSLNFIQDAIEKLSANKISFETFSAKINTDYQGSDGKKNNVTVFVRMRKDSIIWLSVNGLLGIEGMRMLIEKDSVRIMNKLDKEYQTRSLDYLQEVAALPLDLRSMQELIIGNPIFLDSAIKSYSVNDNIISLLCEGGWFRNLVSLHNNDHLILHSKLDDVDVLRSRTCFLNYSEYENKKGMSFSTARNITVTEKTKLDIKLNFKQYAFNETLSFPFSIPKNYKKVE